MKPWPPLSATSSRQTQVTTPFTVPLTVPVTVPAITATDIPGGFARRYTLSYDIGMRELMEAPGPELQQKVIRELREHMEKELEALFTTYTQSPEFTIDVREMARPLIKQELQRAIAARADEFVDELLEDL